MSDAAIAVSGLRESYGSHEAVGGIDFAVERGEVYGFLGPNGAGKSTTIEILEGYRQRSAGEVPVSQLPDWLAQIGRVFPLYHLADGLQSSFLPGGPIRGGDVAVLVLWASAAS